MATVLIVEVAFDPERWHEFFVATVGALAALTGLLFVAMSLHLRSILSHPVLHRRAAITLAALTIAMLVAGIALVPGIEASTIGYILLAVVIISFALSLAVAFRGGSATVADRALRLRVVGTLLMLVTGLYVALSLVLRSGPGLIALAALIGVTVLWSIVNCWELLGASFDEDLP